ncbi:MAG: hypothetical protein LQ344_002305 [Seirophora lacunosa]|nr:MAG: hypothetical protein LQ344_002305 [Seirophora lacunosa]
MALGREAAESIFQALEADCEYKLLDYLILAYLKEKEVHESIVKFIRGHSKVWQRTIYTLRLHRRPLLFGSSASVSTDAAANTVLSQHKQAMFPASSLGTNEEFPSEVFRTKVDISDSIPLWNAVTDKYGVKKILEDQLRYRFQNPDNHVLRNSRQASNGLLLYGPPGFGKTLYIQSLARECNCLILEVNTRDLLAQCLRMLSPEPFAS